MMTHGVIYCSQLCSQGSWPGRRSPGGWSPGVRRGAPWSPRPSPQSVCRTPNSAGWGPGTLLGKGDCVFQANSEATAAALNLTI